MKKTITIFSLLIVTFTKAQMVTADFESFTLTANSFYLDVNGVDFSTSNATFRYDYVNGGFPYWSGGFSYTNVNDTVNGTYTNLYGCIPNKGYSNSNNYVTGQDGGIIKLNSPNNFVNGFYITNTTYDWKVIKKGNGFSRKFGDSTAMHPASCKVCAPDWLKVTVKGFLSGSVKPDSSVFYLADYRFANNTLDYAVKNWQWLDCSNLGNVDSIQFHMYSTDTSGLYLNTPAFFSIDNFTTSQSVGIHELSFFDNVQLYPNPVSSKFKVQSLKFISEPTTLKIFNSLGSEIKLFELTSDNSEFDLSDLNSGMYFAEISNKEQKRTYKIIKD